MEIFDKTNENREKKYITVVIDDQTCRVRVAEIEQTDNSDNVFTFELRKKEKTA